MRLNFARALQMGFIVITIVGLVLLALSGFLSPITKIALAPLIQMQTWVSQRYQALQNLINTPADMTRLRQRNSELEAENARLQIQIIELQQQVSEAQVLATLLSYARSRAENRYIAASVIQYDTNPFLHYIVINRGSDDGLRRGMPVVTNKGLIGQISAVIAGAARVQLITDPGSSVNVYLQASETEAVLQGSLTSDLFLDMIPQSAVVQNGDLVVTSGLGGNYPANLVIGQVTNVRKRDFELFQTANVQPAVDFRSLEIVLVITNFQPVNIEPLIPESEAP
jgi:rod shape-determining protein MreC